MKRFCVIYLAAAFAALAFIFVRPAASLAYGKTQSQPVAATAEEQDPPPAAGQDFPFRRDSTPEIKSYDKVITKDAKSDEGVFTVHRIKDKVYYEIPKNQLNKEFLWVSQIARTTLGVGYGGQAAGNHVVRWERHGNRILLRSISYEVVADQKLPIARAVQAANNDTIIQSFWIEALGKDDAPVIDVTRLFTTEITEFSARTGCARAVSILRAPSSSALWRSRKTSKSKPRTLSLRRPM